jgi:two-component system, cell cycle sensor histidine kinase PleC
MTNFDTSGDSSTPAADRRWGAHGLPAEVIDRINVGFIACDLDGRVTAVNAAFLRMLRRDFWTPGEPLSSCCDADGALAFSRRLGGLQAGRNGDDGPVSLRLRAADGAEVFVEINPTPARNGATPVVYAMVEDVTAHHAREEALKRSEARLLSIVEGAVDAIITCDVRGVIVSANPATCRLFGYQQDLVGENVTLLMPDADKALHAGYIKRYLDTGERRKLGIGREMTARKSDGTLFPVWISLSEIRLPGFHVFLAMLHDISTVKAAEKALIEARDAALLADRAKSSFLANVSHELRTPLNSIIGFADVIISQMREEENAVGYVSFATEIKRAGELLLTNISDILEIASIEAGASHIEESLVDFREAAVSAIRLISKRAQEARLSIEVDLRQEIPPLRADPVALKQVLLHLLSNAVKFTGEGGAIGISAYVDDTSGGLAVEVSDTGCGIPADRLEAIFQPFVQGDDTLSRQYEGVGLGLSLARALVERHGGSVSIKSKENVGTTVTLHLPKERFLEC